MEKKENDRWVRQNSQVCARLREFAQEIGKNVTVYGEWFGAGIQKGIVYLPKGEKGFRVFGARIEEDIVEWDTVAGIAKRIGVRTVPILYRGLPNIENLDHLRAIPSRTAEEHGIDDDKNLAEGVVIFAVPMQKIGLEWLIAKHKRPEHAERKSEREGKALKISVEEAEALSNAQTAAEAFVEEFWTLERLEHVLTYMRESDPSLDTRSSKIIGPAIRGMFDDVMKEGQPEWHALPEDAQRIVGKIHPATTKSLLEAYVRSITDA